MPLRNFGSSGRKCAYCNKLLNELQLKHGCRFCSRSCKSESQKRRINIICSGCSRKFSIRLYLKRSANYCSRDCYRNSTKEGEDRICRQCNKKFYAKGFLIKRGFGFYCNRGCQFKAYPPKIRKYCRQCGKLVKVWPTKAKLVKYCSKKCRDDSMRDYVSRICRKCGKKFELPRSDLNRGRGSFCTHRCFFTYRGQSTLEEKMERALNLAGIKFEREVKFKRFHVDFLLEHRKSIIECDGEYWHLKAKIQERDKRKEKLLSGMGYKVIRFSGKTINKFSDDVLATMVGEAVCG